MARENKDINVENDVNHDHIQGLTSPGKKLHYG